MKQKRSKDEGVQCEWKQSCFLVDVGADRQQGKTMWARRWTVCRRPGTEIQERKPIRLCQSVSVDEVADFTRKKKKNGFLTVPLGA
jgi:hypothetical protein